MKEAGSPKAGERSGEELPCATADIRTRELHPNAKPRTPIITLRIIMDSHSINPSEA